MARRRIYVDELIDAHEVAAILGMHGPRAIFTYEHRHPDDLPRPVVDLGRGRVKLWLRPEIERWQRKRTRR